MKDIRENPTWDAKAFHRHVVRKTKCKVSLSKVYKSFNLAKLKMNGTSGNQYLKLWDYIVELKTTNLVSIFLIKTKNVAVPTAPRIFRGIYICWDALKRGFLEGCRTIIGVDGSHLSGPHKGILLTVVAIDHNNCMYPFAYAVVGQEKKSTWRWFLRLLSKDLDIESPRDYTFISDKQKGLILAMEEVLSGVEHKFCVRHLYSNFRGVHKGLALKNLLWKCARASTMTDFNRVLEDMKVINEAAYTWLESKPGENWSRSHFSFQPKSDILLNNLCESFNACIKDARGKPILSMSEDMRKYLIDLGMKKLEAMRKKTSVYICPKVQLKIEELKKRSHGYIVNYNGIDKFEIKSLRGNSVVVDLVNMTSTCNVWQLSGIPCIHGVVAINRMDHQVEDYVHKCYTRETYLLTYSNVLQPINGEQMWPKTDNPTILPPNVVVQAGRPKKYRRRGPEEPRPPPIKLSRAGTVIKCTNCGIAGHNFRTCGKPSRVRKQGSGIRKSRPRNRPQLVDNNERVDVQVIMKGLKKLWVKLWVKRIWLEVKLLENAWNELVPENDGFWEAASADGLCNNVQGDLCPVN